jgi:hypothetical protein
MKKFAIAAIAIVAALGAVTLYKFKYPTYTYRYRMTVEVNSGGEVRSGSSVIEVNARRQPQFLPEVGPFERWTLGQAVFIELPGGKNIVALLVSGPAGEDADYSVEIIHRLFNVGVEGLPSLRGHRELTTDQMPTLVTVINPNDGASAQVVRPDALDGVLGVHLRSISIEMTADPVTAIDIDSRLPFLVDLGKERLEYRFPRYSSFIRR